MVSIGELAGHDLGRHTVVYDDRDVILYNLAVGATGDELDLVYERDLRALPTMATALGLWAAERAGALGAYDNSRSLHVGQRLETRDPLAPAGALDMTGAVTAVHDKGSAALVEVSVECTAFAATYVLFVPDAGGFGGERGPRGASAEPTGAPELSGELATDPRQALFYRLTGDRHPLHVDPALARAVGFQRPILHGLCTLGALALGLSRLAGRHPADLAALDVRFSAPVLPGDTLVLDAWAGSPCPVRARVAGTTVVAGSLDWA